MVPDPHPPGLDGASHPATAPTRGTQPPPITLGESAHVYDLAQGYVQNHQTPVYPTGCRPLDRALGGGVVPGSIYVVAGPAGTGKTSFVLSLARRMAFDFHRRVIYLSLEMTAQELIERMVCQTIRKSALDLQRVRDQGLMGDQLKPFLRLCQQAAFHIEDQRGASIEDLHLLFGELKAGGSALDLLLIDHLQHQVFTEGLTRADAIANYFADLKTLAKRHHVVILVCSQVNREAVKQGHAELYNLKSSGAIEEGADGVLFLERESLSESKRYDRDAQSEPTELKVRLAKHRRGPLDEFTLIFRPTLYEFDEPTEPLKPKSEVVVLDD